MWSNKLQHRHQIRQFERTSESSALLIRREAIPAMSSVGLGCGDGTKNATPSTVAGNGVSATATTAIASGKRDEAKQEPASLSDGSTNPLPTSGNGDTGHTDTPNYICITFTTVPPLSVSGYYTNEAVPPISSENYEATTTPNYLDATVTSSAFPTQQGDQANDGNPTENCEDAPLPNFIVSSSPASSQYNYTIPSENCDHTLTPSLPGLNDTTSLIIPSNGNDFQQSPS
ncbi:Protein of unknown function, partial [Gryllus bimaculatus]